MLCGVRVEHEQVASGSLSRAEALATIIVGLRLYIVQRADRNLRSVLKRVVYLESL